MKAQTFLDWMEGATMEDIAQRPNRFVYFERDDTQVPEHLKVFIARGYTDDECRPIPKTRTMLGKGQLE